MKEYSKEQAEKHLIDSRKKNSDQIFTSIILLQDFSFVGWEF